jgi:outer membrane protein TolC
MNLLVMIIGVMVISGILSPIAKGIGRRIGKGGPDSADLARIAAALESTEQRLADTERRLHQAEERLDFQEKLLDSRPAPNLPPGPRPGL